ncbi:hypothetical protein EVAR_9827_1 [Eumeta japonica]|uniref:Uncharacterized protein n=1 Tax=Eumeta variegata TaxID=151549 RepID=A0A4C1U5K9_EUMVA|nr:hypothetical protein EVAR_9827_1 [Eumeta japonica]
MLKGAVSIVSSVGTCACARHGPLFVPARRKNASSAALASRGRVTHALYLDTLALEIIQLHVRAAPVPMPLQRFIYDKVSGCRKCPELFRERDDTAVLYLATVPIWQGHYRAPGLIFRDVSFVG